AASARSQAASARSQAASARSQAASARRRVAERRRQQLHRQMRRFEALLPALTTLRLPNLWSVPRRVLHRRLVWAVLVAAVALGGVVGWTALDERWYLYREDLQFNGLTYLDAEELWRRAAIDGWQVFWVDSAAVAQRLRENPYVADVQVQVTPLTPKVTVEVTEVRPLALWVTDQGEFWLREDGRALAPLGPSPPGLLQILDTAAEATLAGAESGTAIDPAVLRSAQALTSHFPGLSPLRYNRLVGLNFRLPNSTYWVYWGDDENVEQKLENLDAAERLLASGQATGTVIDLRQKRLYIK
ncbi:MAG: cell division protein FtsQ/DivIB, partial [Caldilinea sp.]